jgi:outer membrane immunogenic protein
MKMRAPVVAILLAGAVTAAHAQGARAPVGPANWTGGYGGITGGYGWGHSDQTDPGIPPIPHNGGGGEGGDGLYSVQGGLLGGTLGYNWQKGPWVYGVEGDFSWSDIKGRSEVCGAATVLPHPCGTNLNALGTFRSRLGYAAGANGNWLLYGTGGVAIGNLHAWDTLTPASGNVWRAGWTAGAGVETVFAPRWTAKLEYLHVDLGDAQTFNIVPGVQESVGFRADIVRAGINYKFGEESAPTPQLYVKARPMPVANGWSGWYAGLNAGYIDTSRNVGTGADVIANSDTPVTAPNMATGATSRLSTGNGGFIGGAQVGYNLVITPTFLTGFEADIQGSSLRGNASTSTVVLTDTVGGPNTGAFLTNIAVSRSIDYIGTVRARVGATVTPSLLLYVTGGLAYGSVKSSTTITQGGDAAANVPVNTTSGSFSDTRAGYTVGGGGEWMLQSKWSIKAEYLYYDLGSANYGTGRMFSDEGPTGLPAFGVAGIATSTRAHFNGSIARIGVNYHLN